MALTGYKEGQGIWARGIMATIIFIVAVYAAFKLYDFLVIEVEPDSWLHNIVSFQWTMPFVGWTIDFRLIPIAVMLVTFLGFGVWAYNYPKFVDFLVETENELRTRVTWPTRKDLVNASTVVVGAVIVIGVWVLISDWLFIFIFRQTKVFSGLYRLFSS